MNNNLQKSLKKIKFKKGLKGYTLVEMIISIAIISFVIILVGVTLTTLIRTSMVNNIKMQIRDESDLVFDILERNIKQSDPANILLYNSSSVRRYDNGVVETTNVGALDNTYANPLGQGDLTTTANEIHLLPYKSSRWICIGYFKDQPGPAGNGYIVKTSYPSLTFGSGHKDCFDSTLSPYKMNAVVLNSEFNNIVKMGVTYFIAGGDNAMFTFDLSMKSTKRYGAQEFGSIERQLVVATQKLTKN